MNGWLFIGPPDLYYSLNSFLTQKKRKSNISCLPIAFICFFTLISFGAHSEITCKKIKQAKALSLNLVVWLFKYPGQQSQTLEKKLRGERFTKIIFLSTSNDKINL